MSRSATPPAEVPTLTDIVEAPVSSGAFEPLSTSGFALPQGLQKKIVNQVVQRIGITLKTRLRKAGQEPVGLDRDRLVALLCTEVEQAVGSAVDQALAQPASAFAVARKVAQTSSHSQGFGSRHYKK